jgi:hypothetical protein
MLEQQREPVEGLVERLLDEREVLAVPFCAIS